VCTTPLLTHLLVVEQPILEQLYQLMKKEPEPKKIRRVYEFRLK
jgi:hypothetical protein